MNNIEKLNQQNILNEMKKFGWRNDKTVFDFFEFDEHRKNETVKIELFDKYFEISHKDAAVQLLYGNCMLDTILWNNTIENELGFKINDYATLSDFLGNLIQVIKLLKNEKNGIPKRYQTQSGKNFMEILKAEMLTHDEYIGFLKGNVYKYVFRYQKKNGKEDLEKAQNYLRLLEDELNG